LRASVTVRLVCVDERHVEAVLLALGQQGVERIERRREPEIDLLRDAGGCPVPAADIRPLPRHVKRDDAPVRRHGERCDQAGVAGEDADLEIASDAEQLDQHTEESALLGADLHHRHRQRRGLPAQRGKQRMLANPVRKHVVPQLGDGLRFANRSASTGHGLPHWRTP
jgi:hypothetical protein